MTLLDRMQEQHEICLKQAGISPDTWGSPSDHARMISMAYNIALMRLVAMDGKGNDSTGGSIASPKDGK